MKKIITLFVALMLPLFANAANYTEGKQYTVVSESITKKPEVREYFSFYCPHCRSFEPIIGQAKKALPSEVKFQYNHVDFLRGASPQVQQMLSKAVVVAEQLGMQEKLMAALFNYIQVQRAVITSEKDIRNIFVLNGADGAKFDKLMKSFGVNSKAKQMKKNQDSLAQSRGLTSVPTVIINGKYRINVSELDKANFQKDFDNIIKHLLTLK